MNFPIRIEPNPIIEAIVELRFSTKIHRSAVFGILYNSLQNDFKKLESLPILQIPEQLRETDPNFLFKPYYKLTDGTFIIQIGPDVLSISSPSNYIGWPAYSKKIFECLQKVQNTHIIEDISRLGIRYINFFENNIFDYIKIKLFIDNKEHCSKNTVIRTELEKDQYKTTLQIISNVSRIVDNQTLTGSLIDIDTAKESNLYDFFNNMESIINIGHSIEKDFFFNLLTDKLIQSYNPVY